MIEVLSKQDMQALDSHMINNMHIPPRILMENAAFGITAAVCAKYGKYTRAIAVCGTGNNGGDGFAAARQLKAKGYDVAVCLIGRKKQLKGDTADNASFFGDSIIEITTEAAASAHLGGLDGAVVIDAIFGIGLSRDVTGLWAHVIDTLNQSGATIIACDIPSGIDADTGAVLGTAVRAQETVTFQCAKPGHFLYPGREHTGLLTVKEIGVAGGFNTAGMRAYSDGLYLKERPADTHKGSYGKLACVVSSQGYSGAGLMCVCGALKAGAGLVTAGVPSSLQPVFSTRCPDAMTYALSDFVGSLADDCVAGLDRLMEGKTALAAGPGLSTSYGVKNAVDQMVHHYDIKKVFDADVLNIIAHDTDMLLNKKGDIILTPHIGEFSRLCGKDIDAIQKDPLNTAKAFAKKYGVTLLLKGSTTIVTDGERVAFVLTGTPGMAGGGSGDVLTGVIGGLLCGGQAAIQIEKAAQAKQPQPAQSEIAKRSRFAGMDCYTAALYGAYICGKAGEAAAAALGAYSMTAMDTLDHIAQVTKEMTV
ncbi:MAG: NAD(P)H-hydrate dehydratase [Eubacteriales bacterium]|nr:NAD(P)H-hydrate dehydratase [Eubacteriales bacterium]